MRLLLDENLSPRLAQRAAKLGICAVHVAHVGLTGQSDANIFRYAFANDMVLATMNVGDFLTLAGGVDIHPGVIVLRVSGITTEEQWAHLEPALRARLKLRDPAAEMVNQVVEIGGIGRFMRLSIAEDMNRAAVDLGSHAFGGSSVR